MSVYRGKTASLALTLRFACDPTGHRCPLGVKRGPMSLQLASSSALFGPAMRARAFVHFRSGELLSFDFPGRVVRDVHGGVATFTGERGHRITCKRLLAGDTRILPSTSGNEMSTATH